MVTDVLRVADTLLALFWLWMLAVTLLSGRIGGKRGYMASWVKRPGQYWAAVFLMALMVAHFAGLAWVGQKPFS